MSAIKFRSDIMVSINEEATVGTDAGMVRAARAIPPGSQIDNAPRTLGACLSLKHNTPFEHGLMSVYAEAPGVVWWQLTRQRFMSLDSEDFAFNLESGRYKVLEPEFYLPPECRPCREPAGFKPMHPHLDNDALSHSCAVNNLDFVARRSWEHYETMTGMGVAREVARLVLPNWALYCDGYVTAKPLTWLQFFSKRNRTPDTATPTFPQWEIEEFARKCEELFAARWPVTHAAFVQNGRVAP